jgi:DNA (cytosine-5)-methyltransferase 1
MRYFSLFSGIGGFELGFPDDWICVGNSEISKPACAIYKYHFPNVTNYGDATTIIPGQLPDFDILCAGFPCQPFSLSGKREGLDDARGTLFFEIMRICQHKRPRYILLENVRGLLSHQHGETFQTTLACLADGGYLLQWENINSKNFGVPQNRERVFVLGHLRGTPRPQVFPIGEPSKPHPRMEKHGEPISSTVRCGEGQDASMQVVAIKGKYRRLTPLECERLQGFPDGFSKYGLNQAGDIVEMSDNQRYKVLGNAVTVNVVRHIARLIS